MDLLDRLRRLARLGAFLLLGSFCATLRAAATTEYQVKAVFIYNFAQFVQWPDSAFSSPDAPFTIGILGQDPFGGALEEAVRGESVQSHKLVIKRASQPEDLRSCQIVFVSASEKGQYVHVMEVLGPRPILTISDAGGFTQAGGVIDFFRDGARVRFEISPSAAQSNHLKISSQLLKLAKLVGPSP